MELYGTPQNAWHNKYKHVNSWKAHLWVTCHMFECALVAQIVHGAWSVKIGRWLAHNLLLDMNKCYKAFDYPLKVCKYQMNSMVRCIVEPY